VPCEKQLSFAYYILNKTCKKCSVKRLKNCNLEGFFSIILYPNYYFVPSRFFFFFFAYYIKDKVALLVPCQKQLSFAYYILNKTCKKCSVKGLKNCNLEGFFSIILYFIFLPIIIKWLVKREKLIFHPLNVL
jgi:uncharacterized membrane protein (GlpM family)